MYEVVDFNEIKNIKECIYFINLLRECVNNVSFVIEGISENLYLK